MSMVKCWKQGGKNKRIEFSPRLAIFHRKKGRIKRDSKSDAFSRVVHAICNNKRGTLAYWHLAVLVPWLGQE